jgi:hypothetical protein
VAEYGNFLGVGAASVTLGSCKVQYMFCMPHGLGLGYPEMSKLTFWVAVMSLQLWGSYVRSFPAPCMLLGLRIACRSRLSRGDLSSCQSIARFRLTWETEDSGAEDLDTIVICRVHPHGDCHEVFLMQTEALYDFQTCQTTLASSVGHGWYVDGFTAGGWSASPKVL